MKSENAIRRLAGTMVLVSLVLAWLFNPWWLLLAGFVGVNLVQSSFTGFCPAETFLGRFGICGKRKSCCNASSEGESGKSR